jgi:hypothetical protein
MAIIIAPSVILVVDESVDVSVFYSITEEEENNVIKLTFSENNYEDEAFSDVTNKKHLAYYFKNYPKPHLNLISPPPEFI